MAFRRRAIAALLTGALLTLGCVRSPPSPRGLEPEGAGASALPPGVTLEARLGHTHVVTAVAVSPDGSRLVSGSVDQTVRVWDARTGRELMVLPGHRTSITAVSVSSDGRLIASADWDHLVRIWELGTGRLVQRFQGHVGGAARFRVGPGRTGLTNSGTFATFLAGSHRVVSAAYGELLVWDATTGQRLRRIVGHEDGVTALAASPDGRWIVSASADLTIRVWAADTGEELRAIHTGSHDVRSLGLSPDGRWVVSGGSDEPVRVWDVSSGGPGRSLGGPEGHRGHSALSPDGQVIAAVGARTVVTWDLPTGRELHRSPVPWPVGRPIIFLADGRHLVSGNWDGTLTILDVRAGKVVRTATENVVTVQVMALSPDGERLVAGGGDGELRLWRLSELGPTALMEGHRDRISAVAFSPDGRWLVSGSSDDTARLWDGMAGTPVRTLHMHDRVTAVTFSPDGRHVVAAGEQGVIHVWDRGTGRLESVLWGPRTEIRRIVASPDGRRLVSFGRPWWHRGRTRVFDTGTTLATWDLATGKVIASVRPEGVHAALSPDGTVAVTDRGFGTLWAWNTDTLTMTRMFSGHRSWVQAMALSQEGRWLLTGSQDHTLQLRDLTTDTHCVMSKGGGGLFAVAITPDGRLGASTADGATVRVWDLVGGQELVRLVAYADGAWVVLTPENLYHGSPGIEQRLRLRKDVDTYDVARYRSALNRPDLVRARLARESSRGSGASDRRCPSENVGAAQHRFRAPP